MPVTRDEELGEVPSDVTFKALLCFQPGVEWVLVLTVHLNLVKLRELDGKVSCAELVNFLNGARSLLPELVAREVENLQTLIAVLFIQCLQVLQA